jgi:hypothetical protein
MKALHRYFSRGVAEILIHFTKVDPYCSRFDMGRHYFIASHICCATPQRYAHVFRGDIWHACFKEVSKRFDDIKLVP